MEPIAHEAAMASAITEMLYRIDTSCIPQALRKGSNNSEAIAIAAFGDGQTFVCRLEEVDRI
jgi:hypothetical protein